MISENDQDQAALYALGHLDEEERAEFERAIHTNAELRSLAIDLREGAALLSYAAQPRLASPPVAVKQRLLAQVSASTPGRGGSTRTWRATWVPWGIAAAAVGLAAYLYADGNDWRRIAYRAEAHSAHTVHVVAPQPLEQVAVCQLEPTHAGPGQPRATVIWDAQRRRGELVATELEPPGEGHDYQLWAVEQGRKEPVSAGLVHRDFDGRARIEFQPATRHSDKVDAFALSLEKAGGSETNQGPILLMGKF